MERIGSNKKVEKPTTHGEEVLQTRSPTPFSSRVDEKQPSTLSLI